MKKTQDEIIFSQGCVYIFLFLFLNDYRSALTCELMVDLLFESASDYYLKSLENFKGWFNSEAYKLHLRRLALLYSLAEINEQNSECVVFAKQEYRHIINRWPNDDAILTVVNEYAVFLQSLGGMKNLVEAESLLLSFSQKAKEASCAEHADHLARIYFAKSELTTENSKALKFLKKAEYYCSLARERLDKEQKPFSTNRCFFMSQKKTTSTELMPSAAHYIVQAGKDRFF